MVFRSPGAYADLRYLEQRISITCFFRQVAMSIYNSALFYNPIGGAGCCGITNPSGRGAG